MVTARTKPQGPAQPVLENFEFYSTGTPGNLETCLMVRLWNAVADKRLGAELIYRTSLLNTSVEPSKETLTAPKDTSTVRKEIRS